MTSRDVILARIRSAVANAPDVEIPRNYQGAGAHREGIVEHFAERVRDYRAVVHIVNAAEVPDALRDALTRREAERVVVPEGFPADWLAESMIEELTTVDAVVTTCAVAIAETGTIVLDAGVGMGRRALTLVPDYHLCVVRADQIVPGVPDALARLDPVRPLTWISGPSATSDIELNRVEGVHGPRTLEVIISI
ncbi:LUD domain-containing protein [Acrocarpospora sp. B8E8]|uniref:LutC/YkgG family protein n=1 Tax=Acrocarpospora sp. B8E8 TaxID=3153572 RepID=UPI00325C88E9